MNQITKYRILANIVNSFGWRTNRKIVVFESDDWGSIRVPSLDVFNELVGKGIRMDEFCYNRFDSLASEADLTQLFEVLNSVKDANGKSAVFTFNTIVANPDFDKIRESNFEEYHYEPFTKTLKRYPNHQKSFDLWKEGLNEGLIMPQFHGREHLNVTRWMQALRENRGHLRLAFNNRMFDISSSFTDPENSYLGSFKLNDKHELETHKISILEGTDLFEKIFDFRSESFIAPQYTWNNGLNETLKKSGINFLQGNFFQLHPEENKYKKLLHFTGQKNKFGQYYLVRNVTFEPSENYKLDWVNSSLAQISNAFFYKKPAIISTHRMNYIGHIVPTNRDRNLILLGQLLKTIKSRWPDVEFMSSVQLGNTIKNKTN